MDDDKTYVSFSGWIISLLYVLSFCVAFEEMIRYVIFILIGLVFTDLKYYPFLGALRISDDEVVRTFCFIPIVRIQREAMDCRTLKIDGVEFAVFSRYSLDYADESTAKALAKHRDAILFPLSNRMREDFPEYFSPNSNT